MNALAIGLFAIAALASVWTIAASWTAYLPKLRALRAELAWQDLEQLAAAPYAPPANAAKPVRTVRAAGNPVRPAFRLPLALPQVQPVLAA